MWKVWTLLQELRERAPLSLFCEGPDWQGAEHNARKRKRESESEGSSVLEETSRSTSHLQAFCGRERGKEREKKRITASPLFLSVLRDSMNGKFAEGVHRRRQLLRNPHPQSKHTHSARFNRPSFDSTSTPAVQISRRPEKVASRHRQAANKCNRNWALSVPLKASTVERLASEYIKLS